MKHSWSRYGLATIVLLTAVGLALAGRGCASGGLGGRRDAGGGGDANVPPGCGNGQIDTGEECDDGSGNSDTQPNACRTDCRRAHCGDGVIDTGEDCDPPDGETCGSDCRFPLATCGNGTIDAGEECDGGNLNGETCVSRGFDGGSLGCSTSACVFDTSNCHLCGDNICNGSETTCTCPGDCGSQCGDGCCNGSENSSTCSQDCGSNCGDGQCTSGENSCSCPQDCGSQCGDGCCNGNETSCNCYQDCGAVCGDGCCNGNETSCNCYQDCGAQCGDGCCNGNETTCNCYQDCGSQCGDGCCNGSESTCSCPQDCGAQCGDGCCNGSENSSTCPQDCGGGCPGVDVGGTCFYLADPTERTKSEASSICAGLGAGWAICTSTQICQQGVYNYLASAGCDCAGGSNWCNCATPNVYLHALNFTKSIYIRQSPIPNCGSAACTESVLETCGAVLCCN